MNINVCHVVRQCCICNAGNAAHGYGVGSLADTAVRADDQIGIARLVKRESTGKIIK